MCGHHRPAPALYAVPSPLVPMLAGLAISHLLPPRSGVPGEHTCTAKTCPLETPLESSSSHPRVGSAKRVRLLELGSVLCVRVRGTQACCAQTSEASPRRGRPSRLDAVTAATQPPSGTRSIGGAHPEKMTTSSCSTRSTAVLLTIILHQSRRCAPWEILTPWMLSQSPQPDAVGEGCIPSSATSPAARCPVAI